MFYSDLIKPSFGAMAPKPTPDIGTDQWVDITYDVARPASGHYPTLGIIREALERTVRLAKVAVLRDTDVWLYAEKWSFALDHHIDFRVRPHETSWFLSAEARFTLTDAIEYQLRFG